MAIHSITPESVLEILQVVKDPEIPAISVVDLGVITDVQVGPTGKVRVEMVPTFAGCPALSYMQQEAQKALDEAGLAGAVVEVNRNRPWSSNFITPRGRQQLLDFGLSPPPDYDGDLQSGVLEHAICPQCKSRNTELKSPFGPTLCRAIHHCNNCLETFQQFKPL